MSERIQRVNSLIRKELGQIILREIDFPKVVLATLTRVETSIDLSQAKIYISVIPDIETSKVFEILNKEIYNLQQKLNKRLNMRPIPKIVFEREEKTKEAAKVEELLERIKEEKSD